MKTQEEHRNYIYIGDGEISSIVCDACGKSLHGKGCYECDGGCTREIEYNISDNCTTSRIEECIFCEECYNRFTQCAEKGIKLCSYCMETGCYSICKTCEKPIFDEFGYFDGKTVCLNDKCESCIEGGEIKQEICKPSTEIESSGDL